MISIRSCINENKESNMAKYLDNLLQYKNLRELAMRLIRHPMEPQIILTILTTCFAKFTDLQHLDYTYLRYQISLKKKAEESYSCPFTDMDAMAFAYGVSKMSYLKRLTVRIIQ